jgi:hypothetical protein
MKKCHIMMASCLSASLFIAFQKADAITINVTDPTPHYKDTIGACTGIGGPYKDCTSTAYLNTTSLTGKNADFKKSFDAWNAANPIDKKWSLVNGGALPGGAFDVSIFDALAYPSVGGLEIQINWTYDGSDKNDYKWTQGLYNNYLLDGSIVNPFYEMDVIASGCDNSVLLKQCPPLYPFQYEDRRFYDKPLAPWPNSFFDAHTFLAKSNFDTRQLTIYEGVNYGFKLSVVPGPMPILGLVVGFRFSRKLRKRINNETMQSC